MKTALKILTALAAAVGAVYVIATYGEKIVEWAKNLLTSCPCCSKDAEVVEEEAPVEDAPAVETPAEEAPVAEEPAEEPVVEEAEVEIVVESNEPVAEESDFEA